MKTIALEKRKMNCKQINKIKFGKLLPKIGCTPVKSTYKEEWYLSPFRKEKTASFKIDLAKNRYWDFGRGEGGTVIDFWCNYKSCDVKTAISEISNFFFFQKQSYSSEDIKNCAKIKELDSKIKILDVKPISNFRLIKYLSQRGITKRNFPFIREIHYTNNEGKYYSIGFKNDKGGYELRNEYCQNCSSKDITSLIKESSSTLCVFEGFIDFLSYLEQITIEEIDNTNESFIVLNSLSMIQKAKSQFNKFQKVKLFLDNDSEGQKITSKISNEFSNIIDQSYIYKGHKDYNDYHKISVK